MADGTETKIMRALLDHMEEFATDLPISWPGVAFTPPSDSNGPLPYLAITFIPNGAERRFIGSTDPHRFIGMLQVSVFWPKNKGEVAPRNVAGAVADHYPADMRLVNGSVTVRITNRPDVAPMLVEDARIQIPVSIEFEAYA